MSTSNQKLWYKPSLKKALLALAFALLVNTFATIWIEGFGTSIFINPHLVLQTLPSFIIFGLFSWQKFILAVMVLYLAFSLSEGSTSKLQNSKKIFIWLGAFFVLIILYFRLPFSTCDLKSSIDKQGDLLGTQRDSCLMNQARQTLDPKLCTKLDGYDRNTCLIVVGQKTKAYKPCEWSTPLATRPQWSKWECISAVAVSKNDRNKCNEAGEESLRSDCLSNFDRGYQWH